MSVADDLKDIIVTALHADRLASYKEQYQKAHNGKLPSKNQINAFVAMVVATNSVEKEASDLQQDLIYKIKKDAKPKQIISNASIGLPICALLGMFIIFLILGEVPDDFKKEAYRYPAMIGCGVFIVIIVISIIINTLKKDK